MAEKENWFVIRDDENQEVGICEASTPTELKEKIETACIEHFASPDLTLLNKDLEIFFYSIVDSSELPLVVHCEEEHGDLFHATLKKTWKY